LGRYSFCTIPGELIGCQPGFQQPVSREVYHRTDYDAYQRCYQVIITEEMIGFVQVNRDQHADRQAGKTYHEESSIHIDRIAILGILEYGGLVDDVAQYQGAAEAYHHGPDVRY
jgi:hypothetical protein